MELNYVRFYADSSATIDLLSDNEAGRLLKAVLHYINGQDVSLPGQERLIFAMLKAQIERDAEVFASYCEKQRKNGAKGGRPRKAIAFEENPVVFEETQKTQYDNSNKDKYKDNNNNKDNHHDDDARANIGTVEVYATNNLQFMSPGNMQELASFKADLPDDVIRFAIDEACSNGAPRWAYASAILRGYVKEGVKLVGDAKAQKEKRKTAAGSPPKEQNYTTRGYTDADYGDDFFVDLSKANKEASEC